ncbi:MAG: magnesium chelatase domain-containing protein [Clostridia bacterium]
MKSSGFDPPIQKITINLAPTALRKDGASFDLPIALGILLCQSRIPCSSLRRLWSQGSYP